MLSRSRSALHLARWLGPWTPDAKHPRDVTRTEHWVPSGPGASRRMRAWLYQPVRRPVRAAYLISPGLHYAGPEDPRMDRFCKVLAGAGYSVLAPFLPDFLELRVRASLTDDLQRCLDLLLANPSWTANRRPAVFSISFGALPALRLCAMPEYRQRIARLFLFGGYANWSQTLEYCLTGAIDGLAHVERDPLNQPVVYLNLLDALPDVPEDRARLEAAWLHYVKRCWGRPEMKAEDRWQPLARSIAEDLSPELSAYFMLGVGLAPGSYEHCLPALSQPSVAQLLDPRPSMSHIVCPVTIVHGLDDDVIPYTQSEQLHAQLSQHTNSELHLTGLIDHTRSAAKVGAGLREIAILRDICRRLASLE